jgi:acyl-CoA synthetase (AMP-forming)/AMP-acid ligase II/acyl carrier protein
MNFNFESSNELFKNTWVDLLCYRAFHQPEETAYTFLQDGETEPASLTYQELDKQARRIAAFLQKQISPNEPALLLYPVGLEYIASFFGCLYAGVIAIPVYSPKANRSILRIQSIAKDSGAKFALTSQKILSNVDRFFNEAPQLSELRWLSTDDIDEGLAEKWQKHFFNQESVAYLQYTSGSTAIPKGVMVSHRNALCNSADMAYSWTITPNSLIMSWLPHFHDFGLVFGILQPIYSGCLGVLMSPESFIQRPMRWLQAISSYGATHSGAPNFAYELCIEKSKQLDGIEIDLSSWEVAVNGAEPIRKQTLEKFCKIYQNFGFCWSTFSPGYGLAEATLKVCSVQNSHSPTIYTVDSTALEQNRIVEASRHSERSKALIGCGSPLLDTKVIIVDPDSLTQCSLNQVGEIWVSSSSVAQGYWNRVEDTNKTFQAYLADTKEGPFLRTGDLGFFYKGELFVTGRIKDMIIIRGRNYYPQDIELTAEQSHPALRSGFSASFFIEVNDSERLVIALEVKRDCLRSLNVDEVIHAIRQSVAEQHELELYAIVLLKTASIPKTSSGKIQRHACRVNFETGSLDVVGEWRNLNFAREQEKVGIQNENQGQKEYKKIEQWLVKWLLNNQKINQKYLNNLDDQLFNSLSSIEIVAMAADLEDWLGTSVSPTLIMEYTSIQELANQLSN